MNTLLFFLFLAFLARIDVSLAVCDTCLAPNGVACISDTQYNQCFNGIPDRNRKLSCNPGEVCATTGCTVTNLTLAECKVCNQCNTGGLACTGLDTFAECTLGRPGVQSVRCAPTQFCDKSGTTLSTICKPSTMVFVTCNIPDSLLYAGLATPVPITTTTPVTTLNPVSFCSTRARGYHLVPGTKCKDYVNCFSVDGVTNSGQTYTCPGTTVFDPAVKQCVLTYNCPI